MNGLACPNPQTSVETHHSEPLSLEYWVTHLCQTKMMIPKTNVDCGQYGYAAAAKLAGLKR